MAFSRRAAPRLCAWSWAHCAFSLPAAAQEVQSPDFIGSAAEQAPPALAVDQLENRRARWKRRSRSGSVGTLRSGCSRPAAVAPAGREGNILDIALILDAAAAWFSAEGLQTGAHDPPDSGFHLRNSKCHSAKMSITSLVRANLFSAYGVEVEEAYGRTLATWRLGAC